MKSRIDYLINGIYWFLLVCFCILAIITMIQNDVNSIITTAFILFSPIWMFAIGLIFLYWLYYSNWGEKQFNKLINTRWRFFLFTKNKERYVLISKISSFALIVISVIYFIIAMGILRK